MTESIEVTVKTSLGEVVKPPLMDRFIMRCGGANAVCRACDRLSIGVAVLGLVYVIGWTAFVWSGWTNLLEMTPGQMMAGAVAWTPLMGAQIGLGFIRYRAITHLMEEARHLSNVAISGFHQRVAEAIADAVARFEATRREEKPTLQ